MCVLWRAGCATFEHLFDWPHPPPSKIRSNEHFFDFVSVYMRIFVRIAAGCGRVRPVAGLSVPGRVIPRFGYENPSSGRLGAF